MVIGSICFSLSTHALAKSSQMVAVKLNLNPQTSVTMVFLESGDKASIISIGDKH